jgi:hypothetical protein
LGETAWERFITTSFRGSAWCPQLRLKEGPQRSVERARWENPCPRTGRALCTPSLYRGAGDGATASCESHAALLRLRDHLLVSQRGVGVGSGSRDLGRRTAREPLVTLGERRSLDIAPHPVEERGPVRGQIMSSLVLPPSQIASDERPDRRHGVAQVVSRCPQVPLAQPTLDGAGQHGRHEVRAVGSPPTASITGTRRAFATDAASCSAMPRTSTVRWARRA